VSIEAQRPASDSEADSDQLPVRIEVAGGSSIERRASCIGWAGGWYRMTFARKRMGPGGFRGLQIRWAGLSRVGRRVRFPCASATSALLVDASAIGFVGSEGRD